jgi:hypothetical protein
MYPALPDSEYYGGSAPLRTDRSTVDPAQTPRRKRGTGQGPERFPCSRTTRSTKEEPNSVPAASPQLPRSTSPWPPGRTSTCSPASSPPDQRRNGCAPHPAHIHQIGAGEPLRDVVTLVPRVLLFVTLAEPTPSGSTGMSRLCQGCSHPPRHLPGRAALSCTALLRQDGDEGLPPPFELSAPHGARGSRLSRGWTGDRVVVGQAGRRRTARARPDVRAYAWRRRESGTAASRSPCRRLR